MPGQVGGGHAGGHAGGFSGGVHSGGFSGGGHVPHGTGNFGARPVSRSAGRTYRSRSSGSGGGNPDGAGNGFSKLILFAVIGVMCLIAAGPSLVSFLPGRNVPVIDVPAASVFEIVSLQKDIYPLEDFLCDPYDGELLRFEDGIAADETAVSALKTAMGLFYEKTGAEPYLIVKKDLDGAVYPDYDVVSDYMTGEYSGLFGEDEGHVLLLLLSDETDWSFWYIHGNDVIDRFGEDAGSAMYDRMFELADYDDPYDDLLGDLAVSVSDAAEQLTADCYAVVTVDREEVAAMTESDGEAVSRIPVRSPFWTGNVDFGAGIVNETSSFTPFSFGDAVSPLNTVFSDETGLRPVVLFTDALSEEEIADKGTVNRFLRQKVFDHCAYGEFLVSVFVTEKGYEVRYYADSDERSVLDAPAGELLTAMLSDALNGEGSLSVSLTEAFDGAAEKMMAETYTFLADEIAYYKELFAGEDMTVPEPHVLPSAEDGGRADPIIVLMIAVGVLAAVLLVFALRRRKKAASDTSEKDEKRSFFRSSVNDDETYDAHRKEADHAEKAGFKGLENEFPVTCPQCRATAYLTRDGCCQYCGTKLR